MTEKNLKETRQLYVSLTEEELRVFSDELARITTSAFELDAEKKSVMAGFKDKLDKIALDARVLARQISTRRVMRPVECEWSKDFDAKMAYLHRLDTDELIDKRRLTDEELQQALPLPQSEGDGPPEEVVPQT